MKTPKVILPIMVFQSLLIIAAFIYGAVQRQQAVKMSEIIMQKEMDASMAKEMAEKQAEIARAATEMAEECQRKNR
jgi:hypothetical protein